MRFTTNSRITVNGTGTSRQIVKRLRDERGLGDRVLLARAAADEIERLAERIAELEGERDEARGPG